MSHFSKVLDVKQGFNFDKFKQDKVGFLISIKIGEKDELKSDLVTVMDPTAPTQKINGDDGVFAVLSSFDWNTGATDSMYFSGQISTENRQKIASLLMGTWSHVEVEFKFAVYEYELSKKKYFKSAFTEKTLKGLIEKNGSDLNIDVSDDPSHEVQSPQNYAFRIGIKPKSEEQQITLAVGEVRKVAKRWGVTEKAA
jgi:hypothetical protein